MKRRKLALLLIFVVILAVGVSGCESYPQYSLTGQVIDSANSQPIQGVKVSVEGKSATTNKEGIYTINGIDMKSQSVRITFSKQGYSTAIETYFFPTITNTYRLDVGLARN